MTGENVHVYQPVRKKSRFAIDSDSAIMLSTTLSEVSVISTTCYTCSVAHKSNLLLHRQNRCAIYCYIRAYVNAHRKVLQY